MRNATENNTDEDKRTVVDVVKSLQRSENDIFSTKPRAKPRFVRMKFSDNAI